MENRGPYKKFLYKESNAVIPRTTAFNRRRRIQQQQQRESNQPEVADIPIGAGNLVEPHENEHHQREEPLQLNEEAHLVEQLNAEELPENAYEDEDSETETSEDTMSDSDTSGGSSSSEEEEPSRFYNILSDPKLQEKIYPGSNVTQLLAMVVISSFAAKFGLTNEALQALLDILKLFLPANSHLPKTTYFFKKFLGPNGIKVKYYCPECKVGFKKEGDDVVYSFKCSCNETIYSITELLSANCYMFIMAVKYQLKTLLEDCQLGKFLRNHHKQKLGFSDISDGHMYKTFGNGKLLASVFALSLLMSIDGVPVFNSSGVSMWPVSLLLIELPPQLRKKHLMVCSLWIGKGKPSMELLLEDSIHEILELSSSGFTWDLKGEKIKSTVDIIAVCADSVARAPIQNFIQFNGFFGCSWCEQQGDTLNHNHHVYKFDPNFKMRTKEKVNEYARRAEREGYSIMVVNGFSVLSKLPLFNVIDCLVYDVMHAVDLGVMRQLAALWFNTCNNKNPWYIGLSIRQIDAKLSHIVVTSNITRLTRGLADRIHWKASEWRNLLLLYGPYIFKDILPARYYKHFMLLSEAMYILNQTHITPMELYHAKSKLKLFVQQFEELYGLTNMSFNVHQLLHAGDCVSRWGPLWGYSAYGFEDLYGKLMRMFNGTQKVSNQIVNRFRQLQDLKALTAHLIDADEEKFVEIQRKLLGNFVPAKKFLKFDGNVVFIGAGKPHVLSLAEQNSMRNHTITEALNFSKIIISNQLYTVNSYKIRSRRKNCFIMTQGRNLFELTAFYSIKSTRTVKPFPTLFGLPLTYVSLISSNANNQLVSVTQKGNISVIPFESIIAKCIILNSYPLYLSILPNFLDRD